jgi:hypothetical protein
LGYLGRGQRGPHVFVGGFTGVIAGEQTGARDKRDGDQDDAQKKKKMAAAQTHGMNGELGF